MLNEWIIGENTNIGEIHSTSTNPNFAYILSAMRILSLLLLTLVIASCNNGNGNIKNASSTILTDTLLPFKGTWVIKRHIDTLLYTKSPSRSQGTEYFVYFPKSINRLANSYVYHEGGGQYTIVKHGPFYYIVGQESDSTEVVMLTGGETLKVGRDTLIKVPDGVGLAEKMLFAGQYKWNDKMVRFTPDGKVTGLDSLQYYSVQNDYIGPGYGSVDIVFLGTQKDPRTISCFEFIGDTLFIYGVKCLEQDADGTCMYMEKGGLNYKLVAFGRK